MLILKIYIFRIFSMKNFLEGFLIYKNGSSLSKIQSKGFVSRRFQEYIEKGGL